MKNKSMSTKNMLLNISSMKHRAMLLKVKGKAYSALLKDILARDGLSNENAPMPSVKDLCKSSGLRYGKERK